MNRTCAWGRFGVVAGLGIGLLCALARADSGTGVNARDVRALVQKAEGFLKTRQLEDGSFAPKVAGPGVSALVAAGLQRNGNSTQDPLVAKTMTYLESRVKKDGGVYDKALANYTTSVALLAFTQANTGGKYDTVIKRAAEFLKSLQFVDVDDTDPRAGGVGYDKGKRPDLSNVQYFLDGLQEAGVSKDDPAVKRALQFVSRCQNLAGEHNDQPFAKKASQDDKGGFVYNPLESDNRPDRTAAGGLRSSAGMTYAGLKSFLYAGVSKDDPRVQAALRYLKKHYTLEENPGQGQSGLYYYYHTFAKAMSALGEDSFVDADGVKHDWRKELFEALKKRQRPDGSWVNLQDRFGESNPELATAFAVLALSYVRQPGS